MKELEKNIINMYGQKGKQFLLDLPHSIAQIKAEYGLSDLKPVNNLSYNYVLSGFQDKQAIILKLGLDSNGLKREAAALKVFSGFGAVTVLAEKEGMLLLERAISGASLKTYFPEKEYDAIHIMGGCLKKLHQAAPPFLKIFPHIKDWLMVLNKDSSIPDYYLNKARKLRDTLLETSSASVLLHGDLHHDNILQQGDDWVVIDPKGVIGEPAYEVAAFIRNPMPKLLELDNALKIIEHRIHHFAKILEISEHRIWNWCFVQAVLAWAWALEDNGDVSYFQQLTEIFDKKISVWGTRKTQIDTSLDRNLIVTQSPQCANLPAKPLELRFEALTIKDLEILHTWFQVPHVKKWYAKGLDFSKKDIELKYSARIKNKDLVPSFIVHAEHHQIGFIQYYALSDFLPEGIIDYNHELFSQFSPSEIAGVDLFIGDESYLGKGCGAKILHSFLTQIIYPNFKVVVIDPNIENLRAIKAYEKVGFRQFSIEKSEQYNEIIQLMILKKSNL